MKRRKCKVIGHLHRKSEVYDFEDTRGEGWARKKQVMDNFGKIANYSSHASVNDKLKLYASEMFKDTREGSKIYIKLKEEYKGSKEVKQ